MSQSQALQKQPANTELLKKILFKGDLSGLTPEEQIAYYVQRCERVGLDPASKPFDFLETTDKKGQKKITLYPNKEAAAQLTVNRGISIERLEHSEENGVYTIVAHVRTEEGRTGINLSVAHVKGLMGQSYENAVKKAATQAIRRAILMTCGLGEVDESEVADIPNARPLPFPDQEAVMTEAEALSLSHRSSGLDHWKCGRALAMQILNYCADHKLKGMTDDIIKSWLPAGVASRKDLDEGEARYFIANLERRLELFNVCGELAAKGVDSEMMKSRLPGGPQSLKDLSLPQVEDALKAFTHWLKTYNQVVEGSVING
jgi:hypothetical protein